MKSYIMPILGTILTVFAFIQACEHSPPPKTETVQMVINEDSLTKENLLSFIIEQDLESPIIVLKQAYLETGYLTSYGCHERNNLFGFTGQKGYLKFKTWQECVIYYKDMQCRRYNGENYYGWLEKIGWAEDTLYIQKLKRICL